MSLMEMHPLEPQSKGLQDNLQEMAPEHPNLTGFL